MNTNNIELLDGSIKVLQDCGDILVNISETCCMPERSSNMEEAQSSLNTAISTAKESYNNKQSAQKCIDSIGHFGSKVGFLYATCCTPTREPMYQSIFKNLMVAHGNMCGVLGLSH